MLSAVSDCCHRTWKVRKVSTSLTGTAVVTERTPGQRGHPDFVRLSQILLGILYEARLLSGRLQELCIPPQDEEDSKMAACAACQQRKRVYHPECSHSDSRKATRGDSSLSDVIHSLEVFKELPALNTACAQPAAEDNPSSSFATSPISPPQLEPDVEAPPTPDQRAPPPSITQYEQQSAHLLMKACEREEAAEERAEDAEQSLRTVRKQLQASEESAARSEEQLTAAGERIKLLELQVLDRCSSRLPETAANEASRLLALITIRAAAWGPRACKRSLEAPCSCTCVVQILQHNVCTVHNVCRGI